MGSPEAPSALEVHGALVLELMGATMRAPPAASGLRELRRRGSTAAEEGSAMGTHEDGGAIVVEACG